MINSDESRNCPGGGGVANIFLPPANEACVKVSVHGVGVPGPGGRGVWSGGGSWSRGVCGDPLLPPEMATAAGGTHPTGMHSCLA